MTNQYFQKLLHDDYESIRTDNPDFALPPYEDLTAEQKANHEQSYRAMRGFFDELGEAIRTGGPLPDPLKDRK